MAVRHSVFSVVFASEPIWHVIYTKEISSALQFSDIPFQTSLLEIARHDHTITGGLQSLFHFRDVEGGRWSVVV